MRFRARNGERFDGSGTTGQFSSPRPPISLLVGCGDDGFTFCLYIAADSASWTTLEVILGQRNCA
jgi:hypothetical protein